MSTATLPEPPAAASEPPQAAPARRLLTVADYALFPTSLPSGDVRYELNDGVLVVMAPPGDIHARRQANIIRYLLEAEDRGLGEVRGEVNIILRRDPDRVVAPDAAFILAKSLPPKRSKEGFLETIPEIVVEVRSKNDTTPEVLAKVAEYQAAGVLLVWVLDHDAKAVSEHRPNQPVKPYTAADQLSAPDLLPGFAVPVERLFAGS